MSDQPESIGLTASQRSLERAEWALCIGPTRLRTRFSRDAIGISALVVEGPEIPVIAAVYFSSVGGRKRGICRSRLSE